MIRKNIHSLLSEKYRIHVPSFVLKQIRKSSFSDSLRLARQFFPSIHELSNNPDYIIDPLNEEDQDIHPLPYIIHKYPSKLLLLTTDICPIYCRYCTRKRKTIRIDKSSSSKDINNSINLKKVKSYLRTHPEIQEVILSGGDPLVLPDQRLLMLSEAVLREKTISFLRYHTRVATSNPSRFSNNLFKLLKSLKEKYPSKVLSFVFHINHRSEFSKESSDIFKTLYKIGYHLFSQSVLLRRVNDDTKTLNQLFRELMQNNIQPYYLHQLDKIEGASHFYVPLERGLAIMKELRKELPPYMLPRYVQDSKQGKKILFQ